MNVPDLKNLLKLANGLPTDLDDAFPGIREKLDKLEETQGNATNTESDAYNARQEKIDLLQALIDTFDTFTSAATELIDAANAVAEHE